MKKYRIAIEETLRKVVEIEAETPGLAVCRAEDEYNEEKHVLSADNFAGADIALSTDDSTVMETLEDVDSSDTCNAVSRNAGSHIRRRQSPAGIRKFRQRPV